MVTVKGKLHNRNRAGPFLKKCGVLALALMFVVSIRKIHKVRRSSLSLLQQEESGFGVGGSLTMVAYPDPSNPLGIPQGQAPATAVTQPLHPKTLGVNGGALRGQIHQRLNRNDQTAVILHHARQIVYPPYAQRSHGPRGQRYERRERTRDALPNDPFLGTTTTTTTKDSALDAARIESAPPESSSSAVIHNFAPRISVVGIGGAGGNAVNNMIRRGLTGVDFLAMNTDSQHLSTVLAERRLQIGVELTNGLGCGANPDAGRQAAEESRDEIMEALSPSHMVFITAGMGGGTGTGAAPVVAELCYNANILTVAVVTKPFLFEGKHRMRLAEEGLERLRDVVDTLIVIPNQNIFALIDHTTSFRDSFALADDVLLAGVRSITDLMTSPGYINLDFADVQTVMHGMGNAMLGTGEAEGDDRAVMAATQALTNPLLGHMEIGTAKGMLVNITGGDDMTLFEVERAAQTICENVEDETANIIFGSSHDADMEGHIRVSVVATGIEERG